MSKGLSLFEKRRRRNRTALRARAGGAQVVGLRPVVLDPLVRLVLLAGEEGETVVGDTSGRDGTLARIVRLEDRTTVLRRTADDTDPYERIIVANAEPRDEARLLPSRVNA